MPRTTTVLTLAVLAAVPLLLPSPAHADAPTPAARLPSLAPTWPEPPVAVRDAAAVLHDACAAWPRQVQLSPDADPVREQRGKPAEADICEVVLDPDGYRTMVGLTYAALAAAGLGITAASFLAFGALMRLVFDGLRRMAEAAWRRRPARHGWQE